MKNLTVLILAAGYGRRMGIFSQMVNKALIPYGSKPLVSHIIEKFSPDTKFVIACGNMGHQIKDYVSTVHKEKNIVFVDIPDFEEGATGPATTIRYCKEHIRGGFLWITCDTLFEFDFSELLNENWIAIRPVNNDIAQDYCWVECNNTDIISVKNKEKSSHSVSAFIGLMYAKDDTYVNNLENVNAREAYEGFDSNLNLKAYNVSKWQDFGTYNKWKLLNDVLPKISLPKPDELFYYDNNKIIKFTTCASPAKARADRVALNKSCFPNKVTHSGNFLFYEFVEGEPFYNCLTQENFQKFLLWAEGHLWKDVPLPGNTVAKAEEFYYKKTVDRLAKFRTKYVDWVEPFNVNGVAVKTIKEYITNTDFTRLSHNTDWRFIHGDMQFDNIIFNEAVDKFIAIDWRTDFAGDMYGDIYYDLAKMLGGLYLSYKLVKEIGIEYNEDATSVQINILSVDDVDSYVSMLKEWVLNNGLDWHKVLTLVPIIYLNMAPLHEYPFDKYLVALSQLFFAKL